MKAKFEAEISELATPIDDPVYVELCAKYLGAILYDFETRASWKLYRVTAITSFVRTPVSVHRAGKLPASQSIAMLRTDSFWCQQKNMFLSRKSLKPRLYKDTP